MKFKMMDMLIFTLLFIACVSFPFNQLNLEYWARYLIRIGLQLILLILYFWMIIRNGFDAFKQFNRKNLILLSPTFIVVFINLIALLFANSVYYIDPFIDSFYYKGTFFFEMALAILSGVNEEIIFRFMIHNSLAIKNRLLKILVSSLFFALMHLLNYFTGGFNTSALIQVGYTFGLGLILGFIMEYGRSITACMIYHGLYNLMNNVIYSILLVPTYQNQNIQYYLPIGMMALLVFIYVGCIYYFIFRKEEYIYF